MLATSPPCAPKGRTNPTTPQLKRKRSDSCDSIPARDAPVATKPRLPSATDSSTHASPGSPTVSSPSPATPVVAEHPGMSRTFDVSKLRETLEAQLSLEVLLKHNELRLIDQEIAKCQVALEQLRRCAEIPYPGSNVTGISQSVSDGVGMAVLPPGNGPAPLSPAPWGVTDGAYTRHYSRWLLPDPRFDGGVADSGLLLIPGAGPSLMEGRATRANPGDGGGRLQRGSGGARLQSLPNGYPPPKEKAGPMIIRRKSDGVLVKLVCLDCRRDNFSSTQGFINHCRIAHNRNFASHDAAAVASGEPVEVDEAGHAVEGKSTPNTASGYVHPLVRSAHTIESSPTRGSSQETPNGSATPQKLPRTDQSTVETPHLPAGPRCERPSPSMMKKASNHQFTASPYTPHLSSLMQVKGVGLDLSQLVGDAKAGVDFDAYSSEGEPDDETEQPSADVNLEQSNGVRIGRQPMRTTVTQSALQWPGPGSRKGRDKSHHKPPSLRAFVPTETGPYTSPYATLPGQVDGAQEVDGVDPSADFSPNTMECNQAPSLVSDDDDDYEAAMDSESPSPSSSEAGDHDQDLDHINVEDDEGTAATDPKTNSELTGTHHAGLTKPLRRGNMKNDTLLPHPMEPLTVGKDERRVSFSPPGSPGNPTKGKGNSRRPRRTR